MRSDSIGRRHLPHEVPMNVPSDPMGMVFFITVCCIPRGENQLARQAAWDVIEGSLRHRARLGQLRVYLVLAMPDHLHGLFTFPGEKQMEQVIKDFKGWVAKEAAVVWQRDFFDHRLRDAESAAEKAAYIRDNPVRAGLVPRPEDWPYRWPRCGANR